MFIGMTIVVDAYHGVCERQCDVKAGSNRSQSRAHAKQVRCASRAHYFAVHQGTPAAQRHKNDSASLGILLAEHTSTTLRLFALGAPQVLLQALQHQTLSRKKHHDAGVPESLTSSDCAMLRSRLQSWSLSCSSCFFDTNWESELQHVTWECIRDDTGTR